VRKNRFWVIAEDTVHACVLPQLEMEKAFVR
jgi:hypothetical protein